MTINKPLPPAKKMYANAKKSIAQELQPVLDKRAKAGNKLVSKWSRRNRPKFVPRVELSKNRIVGLVLFSNYTTTSSTPGVTIDLLWLWWEYTGTKAHPIFPRVGGGVLRFTVNSEVVFARYIRRHPGTTPKKKTPKLNKVADTQAIKAVSKGLKNVFQ